MSRKILFLIVFVSALGLFLLGSAETTAFDSHFSPGTLSCGTLPGSSDIWVSASAPEVDSSDPASPQQFVIWQAYLGHWNDTTSNPPRVEWISGSNWYGTYIPAGFAAEPGWTFPVWEWSGTAWISLAGGHVQSHSWQSGQGISESGWFIVANRVYWYPTATVAAQYSPWKYSYTDFPDLSAWCYVNPPPPA
jgi:hypothetical protein